MKRLLAGLITAACLGCLPSLVLADDGCGGTCSGVITELTLRYDGRLSDAMIRVTQKERGQVYVLFEGVVQPGEEFTVAGANRDGTLKPNIQIFVNGKMSTPISANCSALIGLDFSKGDFKIVGGVSTQGGVFCAPDEDGPDPDDPEPPDECCDGQVTELTLLYTGDEVDAHVEVTQKDGNDRIVIFDDVVQPMEEFSFAGQNQNGTMGPSIQIFVNGELNATLHTSCSEPIGPGLVSGDFEVVAGESRNAGELCPVDPEEPEPGSCDACDGQATELTLRYIGTEYDARIQAFQKIGRDRVKLYDETHQPGDELTLVGANDRGTFGSKVIMQVNGRVNTTLHTSCSEPIGPGLLSGAFEVVSGESRYGGELCPVEDPEEPSCECDGQVTELTLRYIGTDSDVRVQIFQKANGERIKLVDETMQPGETITFQGANRNGTMGAWIAVQVDEALHTRIHTSCSEPIGPGLVRGDFEVVEGFSRLGGRLCPVD